MNRRRLLSITFGIGCAPLLRTSPVFAQAAPARAELPALQVGDQWRWLRSDKRTGLQEADTLRTITAVGAGRIEASDNDSAVVMTPRLAVMETADFIREGEALFIDFPLEVGKKWSFKYTQAGKTARYKSRWQYDAEVIAVEKVKVPAGEFDAFKIIHKGYWNSETGTGGGAARLTTWYAPAARTSVRLEFDGGNTSNVSVLSELRLKQP